MSDPKIAEVESRVTPKMVLAHAIENCWFSDACQGVGPGDLRRILTELAAELPEIYRECYEQGME